MADYLVRVELFGAEGDEYERLYEGMMSLGLTKTIQSLGQPIKKLPTGTYVGIIQLSAAEVRDSVSRIANPLSKGDAAIFVCEFTNWASFLYPAT